MSTVSARVAAEADVNAVAETLTLAFRTDPVWGPYAFPDPDAQVEQSRRLWAAYAGAAMRFPWTLVTSGCEAVAVWIPPNEPELTEEQAAGFEALGWRCWGPSRLRSCWAPSLPWMRSTPTTTRTIT